MRCYLCSTSSPGIANEKNNCQGYLVDLSPPKSFFRFRWLNMVCFLERAIELVSKRSLISISLWRCLSERCFILKSLSFTTRSQFSQEVRTAGLSLKGKTKLLGTILMSCKFHFWFVFIVAIYSKL